jgi:carbon-monoxide dehydrogenase small subunit
VTCMARATTRYTSPRYSSIAQYALLRSIPTGRPVVDSQPERPLEPARFVGLRVNENEWSGTLPEGEILLDTLRERLRLTGTKRSCEEEICGACTVLVDGAAISACTFLTIEAEGHEVTTIEGLERDGQLDRIQDAFIRHGALQCGFCTPGMILTVKAMLLDELRPDQATVREYLHGSVCRCASYPAIEAAIWDLIGYRGPEPQNGP